MRNLGCFLLIQMLIMSSAFSQKSVLVRMDDMGISHGTNVACIDGFKNGIGTSVEIIVPGPWFEEAAQLLQEHPDLDVGIHLALSCEWDTYKWRPLTHCPSLVDDDGYLVPMIWPNENYSKEQILQQKAYDLAEMEKELRAQITLGLKKIPQVSHLSHHMGCMHISEETKALYQKLAEEFQLKMIETYPTVQAFPKWNDLEWTTAQKEDAFINAIAALPDGDYMVVSHLTTDSPESRAIGLRYARDSH